MKTSAKRRYVYAGTGFVLLLFLGLLYSWSVFIGPLESAFGWQRSETSSIFTVSIVFFWVGNVVSGFVTQRFSARATILVSAMAAAAGFGASALTPSLAWIYVSYGALCGFATGMGSNGVLSAVLKWFPDHPGTASGALMTAIGLGSLVLSPAVTALLGQVGWSGTFAVLAVVFGALLAAGALVLKEPPDGPPDGKPAPARKDSVRPAASYTTKEMLGTRTFWTFMLWAVLIGTGGLALISNAVPAAQDVLSGSMEAEAALLTATMAMGSISAFNGFGRLASGLAWDKLGCRVTTVVVSSVYLVSMAACAVGTSTGFFPLLVLGFIALGTAYGASLATVSALVSGVFGQKHYGMNYACALLNMVVAACAGPTVSGALRSSTGSYFDAYLAFFVLAAASLAVALFLRLPNTPSEREKAAERPQAAAPGDRAPSPVAMTRALAKTPAKLASCAGLIPPGMTLDSSLLTSGSLSASDTGSTANQC